MTYKPKYLKKKAVSPISGGISFNSKGIGNGTLMINGEDVTKDTKKAVITIEAGEITKVELTKLTTGDIDIDGDVEIIESENRQCSKLKLNVGGKELGSIAIKALNNYHERIGRTEINI